MATELWADTNILIRFLANDHPEHSVIARQLMQEVKNGRVVLHINPMVIAECCFVLQGKVYNYDRNTIASKLTFLLNIKGIKSADKTVLLQALSDYGSNNIDFEDAYITSYAKLNSPNGIVSFNIKDFKKINAECYEPEQVLKLLEDS